MRWCAECDVRLETRGRCHLCGQAAWVHIVDGPNLLVVRKCRAVRCRGGHVLIRDKVPA